MTQSLTTSSMTAMPRLMSAKRFAAYLGEKGFVRKSVLIFLCADMTRGNIGTRTLMIVAWRITNSHPL